MNSKKIRILSVKLLDQLIKKHLQRVFTTWSVTKKFLRPRVRVHVRKFNLTINPDPKSRKVETPKSPIEISNRLYSKAKEIQQKRESLLRLKTQEFNFAPKVNGSTGKWQQIKNNSVKGKTNKEPLAVVSAQAVCSALHTNFNRSLTPII